MAEKRQQKLMNGKSTAWAKMLMVKRVLLCVMEKFEANKELHDHIFKMNLIAERL